MTFVLPQLHPSTFVLTLHCNSKILGLAYLCLYLFSVDFLSEVGVDPSEDGIDPGTPLTDSTTSQAWRQMSLDFPVGFAIYAQAVLDQYMGTMFSINNGDLLVGIESFGGLNSMLQTLTVSLPGQIPLRAAIPNVMAASQTIGLSVQSKLLMVVINCSIINAVWLANMPDTLNFTTVEVFNPSTTVSVIHTVHGTYNLICAMNFCR